MSTPVTHGFLGMAFAYVLAPGKRLLFSFFCVACSVFPDVDKVVSKLFGTGWPGSSAFENRGFTHSILFAVLMAAPVACIAALTRKFARPWWVLGLGLLVVSMSHGALDAFTHGSVGIAFFDPFSAKRYLAPVTPLPTISYREFFTPVGWKLFLSEVLWVWVPVLCALVLFDVFRRRRAHSAS
jgi:inner membrane protein